MITLKTDDGPIYVNPDHIIYMCENSEDGVSWVEMQLSTEQVFEVDGPMEEILKQIKGD